MNTINANRLIAALTEQFVEVGALDWERPKQAAYFCVRGSVENFGFEKDGNTRHETWKCLASVAAHVIITARHRVYVALGNHGSKLEDIPAKDWYNTSNHDSCWKTDGLNKVEIALKKIVIEAKNSTLDVEHRKGFPEVVYSGHFGLGNWVHQEPIQFVEVERAPLEGDSYRDQLTSVKRLSFKILLGE